MNKKKPSTSIEHDDSAGVDAVIAGLPESVRPIVESLRKLVLSSGRNVTEGVKWKSASFWCNGWFATINVRPKAGVTLILHHGVVARPDSQVRTAIGDLEEMLTWHSADRASISFADSESLEKASKALARIIKKWVQFHAALTTAQTG